MGDKQAACVADDGIRLSKSSEKGQSQSLQHRYNEASYQNCAQQFVAASPYDYEPTLACQFIGQERILTTTSETQQSGQMNAYSMAFANQQQQPQTWPQASGDHYETTRAAYQNCEPLRATQFEAPQAYMQPSGQHSIGYLPQPQVQQQHLGGEYLIHNQTAAGFDTGASFIREQEAFMRHPMQHATHNLCTIDQQQHLAQFQSQASGGDLSSYT